MRGDGRAGTYLSALKMLSVGASESKRTVRAARGGRLQLHVISAGDTAARILDRGR